MTPADVSHRVAVALRNSSVPPDALALVHVIADNGTKPTTQAELSTILDVDLRTVRRQVAHLVDAGLLEVERTANRGPDGGRGPSVYRLTPPH